MNRWVARLGISLATMLGAALVAVGGIGFLLVALYLALIERMSPATAALLLGVTAILLAALIVFAGQAAVSRTKKRRRDSEKMAAELRELFGDEFAALARSHPQTAVFAALMSGFAVGVIPELRTVLRDLLHKS